MYIDKSIYKDQFYLSYQSAFLYLDDFFMSHLAHKNVYCVLEGYDSELRKVLLDNFQSYQIKSLICKGALQFTTTPTLTVNTEKSEKILETKSIGFFNNRFDKPLGKPMKNVFVIAFLRDKVKEFVTLLNVSKVDYLVGVPTKLKSISESLFRNINGRVVVSHNMRFTCIGHDKHGVIYEPLEIAPSYINVNWYSNV